MPFVFGGGSVKIEFKRGLSVPLYRERDE